MAVLKNNSNLKYLPKEILSDKGKINIILDEILLQNRNKIYFTPHLVRALAYLPIEYADDEDIVLKCIKLNPTSYSIVTKRIRNNREFAYNLINEGINISRYLTSELKSDREFIKFACEKSISYLEFASFQLKNDQTFILEIQHIINESKLYNNYGKDDYLEYMDEDLESSIFSNKEDKNNQINEEFLDYNKLACSFEFASEELKENQKFIKKIIKLQPRSIEFISEHLKKDIVFLKKCLKTNPEIYSYLLKSVQENDELKACYQKKKKE
jgi:hypothetical protein